MPKKPKRPCSYPGCPELVHGRYCETHQKEIDKRYERFERDPDTSRRYGKEWRRIRSRYITEHPLCEECQKNGRLTPARQVHHIIPIVRGGTHAEENLQSLCTSCHSHITASEGGRWQKKL